MTLLAEINPTSAIPWLWFAGALAAYIAFLALNPLAPCFGRAYLLVRSRPHLWFLPAAFGFFSAAASLQLGTAQASTIASPADLGRGALAHSWDILPTFPHILVSAYPLSLAAAALFLTNAGGVLAAFSRSEAWTGRVSWVAGLGFTILSAICHLTVAGASFFPSDWSPPFALRILSEAFAIVTAMFVQAYLIASAILAAASARPTSTSSPRTAMLRAAECFPRILPLTALYLVVWALDTYGGNAPSTAFASRFIVPEILLVLAFLPPSALVVRGGFTAVGGVALGALIRSWWVWLCGLAAIFLTAFIAQIASLGLGSAWPANSPEGAAWRLIFPLLWGALATWILVAWALAFHRFVLPAAGAKSKPSKSSPRTAPRPPR